jgi:hypothetical protein
MGMTIALNRGMALNNTGGAGAVTLATIQRMFSGGVPGFIYDPSQLSDDQTATPSDPALPGDPVAYFFDHSGNGNHGTLTTFAHYPTLTESNGKYFYACDGVDNHIASPVVNLSAVSQCTILVAMRINTWALGNIYMGTTLQEQVGRVGCFTVENVQPGGHYSIQSLISGATGRRFHNSADNASSANYRFGRTSVQHAVLRIKVDLTKSDADEFQTFWNGYSIGRIQGGADTGSTFMSSTQAFNFAGRGATNNTNMSIYGCALIGKATSAAEDAALDAYFGSLIEWPFADGFDLFLAAGDSNALGAAHPLDAGIDVSDGVYWPGTGTGFTDFNQVKAANDNFDGAVNGGNPSIGAWTSFIRTFMTERPGRIPMIVHGPWGGTGFSDGNWTVSTGPYYIRALALMEMALASRIKGKNRVLGCFFFGGTNDTGFAGDPVFTGAQWSAAMSDTIDGLRTDIDGAQNMPLVVAPLVPRFLITNGANAVDIQSAIDDLPSVISRCAVIDPTGLTLPAMNDTLEPHHFNPVAQRNLGPEFYTAWVSVA